MYERPASVYFTQVPPSVLVLPLPIRPPPPALIPTWEYTGPAHLSQLSFFYVLHSLFAHSIH